jgi:hypothetical protein
METNWQDITRRLDINQADVTETCNPKPRGKGRAIGKVNYQFTIPAVNIDLGAAGVNSYGALFHQFNYTAPSSFRILNWTKGQATTDITNMCLVAVRYRVGTTVYRYRLTVANDSALDELFDSFFAVVRAPRYNGERIGANFSIELWSYFSSGRPVILNDITVTTGLLALPSSSNETEQDIPLAQTMNRAALALPMPEFLPVTYDAGSQWLTN